MMTEAVVRFPTAALMVQTATVPIIYMNPTAPGELVLQHHPLGT